MALESIDRLGGFCKVEEEARPRDLFFVVSVVTLVRTALSLVLLMMGWRSAKAGGMIFGGLLDCRSDMRELLMLVLK